MTRIGRDQMFMEIARVVSKRSTCARLNVGAVIVAENRVVSIGYAGSPPGEPHCTEVGCQITSTNGCSRTVHAEVNAINYLPFSLTNLSLYVTNSPCRACVAKILAFRGISRIFYETPYRDIEAIEQLMANQLEVYRILPNGYILGNG